MTKSKKSGLPHFSILFPKSSVDVFGRNYLASNIRRKRRIMAKQGRLLTKQGRKRKVY